MYESCTFIIHLIYQTYQLNLARIASGGFTNTKEQKTVMKWTPPAPCSRPSETLPPTMPAMGRAFGPKLGKAMTLQYPQKDMEAFDSWMFCSIMLKVAVTDHKITIYQELPYSWYMLEQHVKR